MNTDVQHLAQNGPCVIRLLSLSLSLDYLHLLGEVKEL